MNEHDNNNNKRQRQSACEKKLQEFYMYQTIEFGAHINDIKMA